MTTHMFPFTAMEQAFDTMDRSLMGWSSPLPTSAAGEHRVRQVSVAPLFGEALSSIYEETSITRLFV